MNVLGIETSCDDTAAAVVRDGRTILASTVKSQNALHRPFGGVVPEIASRGHIAEILPVVEAALSEARLSIENIDAVAATRGPGLIGSLLVGLSAAKAIAFARNIPFVGVHHVEGHLITAFLSDEEPAFPLVGLVASGGHTSLYRIDGFHTYKLLAQTRDDAAGEAFDKVAKLCNLGFPGGPAIEGTAEGGNVRAIDFPRPRTDSEDFSFSGLKTAVAVWVQRNGIPQGKALTDLAASFQEAVVDVLVEKLGAAAQREGARGIAACGGVACNRRLRARIEEIAAQRGLSLHLAPPGLCTDNAAMIAAAAFGRLSRGESDGLDLNAVAAIGFG